jgi:uncharacterized membrane protein YgcG
MKKIILSIFLILSIVLTINSVNALTAKTCSSSISIKYYTVPVTITRSICLINENSIPVTVTFETSSNLNSILQFSQNPVTLAVGEKKFVSFNANINQDAYVSGSISSTFRPAPGYTDNMPYVTAPATSVTISKGACNNGQTQACTLDTCDGTETCENYAWGTCIKTNPTCGGVCQENWQCSAWTTCTNGQQTRTCTDANSCGTINNKPITFTACSGTCTESWSCGSWTTCANGQQTRTCTDANSCGTTANKPVVSQSCSGTCTEAWSCSDWGACQSTSTQTRTCTDANSCGTTANKPAVSQGCTYNSGGGNSGGGSSGGGSSGGGSSGGGSGGSGGGSTYDSCKSRVWECTPLGECIKGLQNNTCKDVTPAGKCATKKSAKIEAKNCTVEEEEEIIITNTNKPSENKNKNTTQTTQQTNQTTNTNQGNEQNNQITGQATFADKIKGINILNFSTTGGKVLVLGLVSALFIGILVYFSMYKK